MEDQLQGLQDQIDGLSDQVNKPPITQKDDSMIALKRIPQGQGSNLSSDKVDGIDATTVPMPNCLLPLGPDGKFPSGVIPGSSGGSGFAYGVVTPTDKNILVADGTLWQSRAMSGDATITADTGTLTLANTAVTPTTYGDATHVGSFTVDSKGRITAASSPAITFPTQVWSQIYTSTSVSSTNASPLSVNIPDSPGFYQVNFDLLLTVSGGIIGIRVNSDTTGSAHRFALSTVWDGTTHSFVGGASTYVQLTPHTTSHDEIATNSRLYGSFILINVVSGLTIFNSINTWTNGADQTAGTYASTVGNGWYITSGATSIQLLPSAGTITGAIEIWERKP